ncbi:hypothetical protein KEM52_004081 [Ascosphaera acerosa]|nr:hypothetical protein KEM52_004081 [Ascosphaera acerosa]
MHCHTWDELNFGAPFLTSLVTEQRGNRHNPDFTMTCFRDPSRVGVVRLYIDAWHNLPNSTISDKPVYIYHDAFAPAAPGAGHGDRDSSATRNAVAASIPADSVTPQWTYTMFPKCHFHSTTPEVLYVLAGSADLCFGGSQNPRRGEETVKAGDVVVIPAGVAHHLLEDRTGDFEMLGCYPPGKSWDMRDEAEREARRGGVARNIARAGWLAHDPVFGESGPTLSSP